MAESGPHSLVRQRGHELSHGRLQQGQSPSQIQTKIEGDLLVARATRVQPPAGLADALDELALDERVDVLVRGPVELRRIGTHRFAQIVQRRDDLRHFVRRQHARRRQRLGPRLAAGDIVVDEAAIDA